MHTQTPFKEMHTLCGRNILLDKMLLPFLGSSKQPFLGNDGQSPRLQSAGSLYRHTVKPTNALQLSPSTDMPCELLLLYQAYKSPKHPQLTVLLTEQDFNSLLAHIMDNFKCCFDWFLQNCLQSQIKNESFLYCALPISGLQGMKNNSGLSGPLLVLLFCCTSVVFSGINVFFFSTVCVHLTK